MVGTRSLLQYLTLLKSKHICLEKYRVSTTNVPIIIEIRSEDKIRFIFFDRSSNGQTSNMAENEDWVQMAKPVHIAQNQSRPL